MDFLQTGCYSDVIAHLSPCEPVIVWAFSGVHLSSVSLSVVHRRLSTVCCINGPGHMTKMNATPMIC